MKTCAKCERTNLVNGTFAGLQPLRFKAEETPAFTLTDEDVIVDAVLCLDCAHVELAARIEDVLRMRQKIERRSE